MQTFLPYPDFTASAMHLDDRRLGKQRVECLQILNVLWDLAVDPQYKGPWISHPATLMWKGHERALCCYATAICIEWQQRGFKDTCLDKIVKLAILFRDRTLDMPPWLGREDIHASHRSNLLRKKPKHYGQFNWPESDDLPYVWPVTKRKTPTT